MRRTLSSVMSIQWSGKRLLSVTQISKLIFRSSTIRKQTAVWMSVPQSATGVVGASTHVNGWLFLVLLDMVLNTLAKRCVIGTTVATRDFRVTRNVSEVVWNPRLR